jgi:D-sedoheptulose 7-phosphate isomerase
MLATFDSWRDYQAQLSRATVTTRGANFEQQIERSAQLLALILRSGGRVAIAGNGGSCADAEHFAGELSASFTRERAALDAIALPHNTAALTAWSNDYSFESVIARQVEAHLRRGDGLVLISTSGQSRNLIRAAETARACGISTISLLGESASRLDELSDVALHVDHWLTPIIQDVHSSIIHFVCARIESINFPNAPLRYSMHGRQSGVGE